jgi:hypothetical protein
LDVVVLQQVSSAITDTIDFDQSIIEHRDVTHLEVVDPEEQNDERSEEQPRIPGPPRKRIKTPLPSEKEAKAIIKPGIDEKLDEMKQFYAGLAEFLVLILS